MLDPAILADYNALRHTQNKSIFCHAPFTSINFEQNGNATVCCYNRQHVLGTYPSDSIEEMWYGQRADQLRAFMRRNMLPDSCWICLDQFRNRNFGGLRARFYDQLAEDTYSESNGRFQPMPKVMEFEISNTCNLECSMCNGYFSSSIRKHREGRPPLANPYDAAFVHQLEPFIPHLSEARFLGGEPFLIKRYYEIWDRIAVLKPDIDVTIVTNGTILTEKVKSVLQRINAHINVSIDSLDPSTYERIRINASFAKVMENLRYFREYVERRGTSMTLNVCPMQDNWRELPHFLSFCNDHGIRLFFNTLLHPEEASLRSMGIDRLNEVVDHLRAVDIPDTTPLEADNRVNYLDLIHQVEGFRKTAGIFYEYDSFQEVDLASSTWALRTTAGNVAELVAPPAAPGTLRIEVGKVVSKAPWDIQLNRGTIPIKSDHRYVIRCRARAAEARYLCFGITAAESPWDALGRHADVQLTPEWQTFHVGFGPTRAGDARLHFDVGGDSTPVELADISLRCRPTVGAAENPS